MTGAAAALFICNGDDADFAAVLCRIVRVQGEPRVVGLRALERGHELAVFAVVDAEAVCDGVIAVLRADAARAVKGCALYRVDELQLFDVERGVDNVFIGRISLGYCDRAAGKAARQAENLKGTLFFLAVRPVTENNGFDRSCVFLAVLCFLSSSKIFP